ncbi:hypothetical protein BDY17DRAFT_185700 [Neohortaea acidophila]|uniref:Uncharacterized protein n=1 Tax=Neohortaea acidophila TaxID=245834 RepID=A0A6A6PMP2_9PEZI|nr:uncharacterized protein BDY17DRAFT_185700 [Neohortaea acidophila]KAF2481272.1 hypothetical protein BDY17DRAFT_185700 [Neohortaea acidophila]
MRKSDLHHRLKKPPSSPSGELPGTISALAECIAALAPKEFRVILSAARRWLVLFTTLLDHSPPPLFSRGVVKREAAGISRPPPRSRSPSEGAWVERRFIDGRPCAAPSSASSKPASSSESSPAPPVIQPRPASMEPRPARSCWNEGRGGCSARMPGWFASRVVLDMARVWPIEAAAAVAVAADPGPPGSLSRMDDAGASTGDRGLSAPPVA